MGKSFELVGRNDETNEIIVMTSEFSAVLSPKEGDWVERVLLPDELNEFHHIMDKRLASEYLRAAKNWFRSKDQVS